MSEELAGQTVASLQLGVPFMVALYAIIGIVILTQIIVVTFQK
ncbi:MULTISPECIES: hypothetical protein [Ectothiorhodospira]|uniref:Uncharacterized protein n=1 Tax=Ectothiorhodospira marina TaxID=1396821 RepID=A0A1H7RDB9_9GAMM|nr:MULTISPECIES: hypothetical protein [Ectothiorhodospira]SEL57958.1 hypothetical protein SAMN05444515_12210 [Ectothiorhodospira marina]